MAGFIADPIQFVNLITDNLRDRYQSGFPVLKELIQNTDDAPAAELHYGLSPGLPDATHTLLRGPGLFLINNGQFKPSDARGIRSFGQNAKAADEASIGKFGLGMKSVFHFCEAFFFLAHDGERPYREVLNPWSGGDGVQSLHPDWDEFDESDALAIRRHLGAIISGMGAVSEQCFILWLPLRRKEHLRTPDGDRTGAIISEYPGDDPTLLEFLDRRELSVKIASIVPMLRHLKRTAYWNLVKPQLPMRPDFEVVLGGDAQRLSFLEAGNASVSERKQNPLSGRIKISNAEATQTLEFLGLEYFAWNANLAKMHNHELWPSSYVRNDFGHSEEAKDKAKPHGAVLFSRIPGQGSLTTNWSVFLPLDEDTASESVYCDADHDFRLTLHGYFFIDAGRQGVRGYDGCDGFEFSEIDSEEGLRRAWNCELLRSVVLPLVIPALKDFCAGLRMPEKAVTALATALNQTTVFRRFKEQIAADHYWIREISQGGIGWSLRDNSKKVLSLPAPPESDSGRPWRVFSFLAQVAENFWLSVGGAPSIISAEGNSQWSVELLSFLLDGVDAQALFSETALIDYFAAFLRETAGPYVNSVAVNKQLMGVVRTGLVKLGETALGKNEQRVREVIRCLDETICFRLDNQIPTHLLTQLLSVDTDVLLLPGRFCLPERKTGCSLTVDDAAALLQVIQSAVGSLGNRSSEIQKSALSLSEKFIKGVPRESRQALLDRCSDLKILGAFDCITSRQIGVSTHELRRARDDGVLFGYAQGVSLHERLGLAALLQSVLPQDRILVVNKDVAEIGLNVDRALAPCSATTALHALAKGTRVLGDIESRKALANVVGTIADELAVKGLRFLLHAGEAHFDDLSTPLWVLGEEQEAVWQKLWGQLVDGKGNPWNLLDVGIADGLSREVSRKVGLREISRHGVVEEIERQGGGELDFEAFEDEERDQILSAINDDNVWKSLRIHRTTRGGLVAGDAPNVYLDCGVGKLEEAFLGDVHLIECSTEYELARRQKSLLKLLDEIAAIEIALDHSDNHEAWLQVMDAIHKADKVPSGLPCELAERIRKTPWVPSVTGECRRPDDVIDLGIADSELERILRQAPGTFLTPSGLAAEITQHPAFSNLRERYFARGEKGLECLGLVISDLRSYAIDCVEFESADAIKNFSGLLGSSPHPGWRLLGTIAQGSDDAIDLRHLAAAMNGPMDMDALLSLLSWIVDQGNPATQWVDMFNRYLDVFATRPDARAALPRLKLLSEAKNWVPAGDLVSGVVGVAPESVLDDRQARTLSRVIGQSNGTGKAKRAPDEANRVQGSKAAEKVVREYFQPWDGRVSNSLIAGLVVLLGEETSMKLLCEDFLGLHSRDWLVEQIPWEKPRVGGPRDPISRITGYSLEKALAAFHVAVRIHDQAKLRVRSITGKVISAALAEAQSGLFVGKPRCAPRPGGDGFDIVLTLRRIEVGSSSDAQLASYLKNSITYLLKELYEQPYPHLEALWSELDKSDQVDIDLARSLILQNIPFYLKQLGAHKNALLTATLNKFRDRERKEQEHRGTKKEVDYRLAKGEALSELQRLIESDAQAQKAILDSVVRKVRDFQYLPDSVPFELFQNADDALSDLEMINAYPEEPGQGSVQLLPRMICRFVVEASPESLRFLHWGRAINQFGSSGFPGRERGFDRDLENMLILSASDKGEGVTGKFGLGFKSVWLVSNRPTIVSGRLQAEIVGGVLPKLPDSELAAELRDRLLTLQPDYRWPGTAIDVPLVESEASDVLRRFTDVAGFVVAFARSVCAISLSGIDRYEHVFSWEAQQLPGCDAISFGSVRYQNDDQLVVKIDLPDGALLFSVGPDGFTELPVGVPSVWVTAPIKEQERLGFAINAMFDVDAGRSRLSGSLEGNERLAKRLGQQFGAVLDDLHAAVSSQWTDIAASLRFSPVLQPYNFWASLWRVMMARLSQMQRGSASRVIAVEVLRESLQKLGYRHAVVPNGLPGKLQQLIRWPEVTTVIRGALMDSGVSMAVCSTNCFSKSLDAGTSITANVAMWFRMLELDSDTDTRQWRILSLSSLFESLDAGEPITFEDAEQLGGSLGPETLEAWRADNAEYSTDAINDLVRAAENAKRIKFFSASKTGERNKMLLANWANKEETLRWAFAPGRNRLDPSYRGSALDFFLFCRDKLEAPAERMRDWVLESVDHGKRQAALGYLLRGELSRQLADALHETGVGGTWLAEVTEGSKYLTSFSAEERARLVYQVLKTPEQSKTAFTSLDSNIQPVQEIIDAEPALNAIYDWWAEARDEEIEKYQKQTFPQGQKLVLESDQYGDFDRSSWLTLLLLGGFHQMGRPQPWHHRSFIEKCHDFGWWEVFTTPDPTQHFERWMDVLEKYVDSQVDTQEYEQWMMRFPIIYKLSRYLGEYVDLFWNLDKAQQNFDLGLFLKSRVNPQQQGGGASAPPLDKTLGMGANFIIRELIRSRVIQNPHLHKDAFVPYKAVRELLNTIGCVDLEDHQRLSQSPLIFDFVVKHLGKERATFQGDFDMPLRIVAGDWLLQERLIGCGVTISDG